LPEVVFLVYPSLALKIDGISINFCKITVSFNTATGQTTKMSLR